MRLESSSLHMVQVFLYKNICLLKVCFRNVIAPLTGSQDQSRRGNLSWHSHSPSAVTYRCLLSCLSSP